MIALWQQRKHYRSPFILIGLWSLLMVLVPHALWNFGDRAIAPAVILTTLAQASAVLAVLRLQWSWRTIGRIFFLVAILTFSAEAIGTATGFPFGAYSYTDRLQPQLLHVPLLIPIAWFMMLPSCWAIAQPWRKNRWLFSLISAGALTSWDLLLDPQMVNWQLWHWDRNFGYFGIPWSNFVGWFATAFLVTIILSYTTSIWERNLPIPQLFLLLLFTMTWFFEVFGLIFIFSLPLPGLVGGLIMGVFVFVGWQFSAETDTNST